MVANFIACAAMEWESEFIAQTQLKRVLDANCRSNEYWVVLSNLTITDSRNQSANEIDFLLIGPTGLRLIEAKGWRKPFVQREWDSRVTKECELISKKARKLSGSLKQLPFDTGEIRGYLLLSEEPSWDKPCKGVTLFGKQQISKILDDSSDTRLTKDQIDQVAMCLKPKDTLLKLGRLKRLSDILLNPYEASRKPQPGRVLTGRKERLKAEVDVHVFDLSGERSDEHKEKARREADVIGALQKFPGIPKLIDSFQEANEFAGEIFFYAVEKPNGTPVSEKVKAADWTIEDRLSFTVKSLQYLSTLHTAYEATYVHRGITPDTLLVDSSNLPIFTNFSNSRTPSPISVANVASIDTSALWTPPEVLKYGASSADQRSDTYSLCYVLRQVLAVNDEKCGMISTVIEDGLVQDPTARKSVKELLQEITDYLEDEEKESIFISNAGISRGDIVSFNGRKYEITEYLGQGGFARAYGVGVPGADTTLYCAKSFVNRKRAEEFLNKCDKLRPLSVKKGFQTVFEVTGNLSHDPIHVLMEYVPGRTLESLRGCCREYIENNLDGNFWHVISDWIKDVLFSLNDLHCSGFVHGDISLGNLIVNENRIAIIDLDSIVPAGERAEFLGTTSYMPVEFLEDRIASPSHDVFSLAAAMFHLIFDQEPFLYSGLYNRGNGVNWSSVRQKEWDFGVLKSFINTATAVNPKKRFRSASHALQWIDDTLGASICIGPISLEEACAAAGRNVATKLQLHREVPKLEEGINEFIRRQPPNSAWTEDKARSLLSYFLTITPDNPEMDAILAELRLCIVNKELRSLDITERLSKVTKDDFVGVERNGNDVTIRYRGTKEEQAIDEVITNHLADKSSTLWESLADWAYDKECFSIISRRFLQDFARRFSGDWVPNREQCQWAGELVHRAVENGFSLDEW